MATTATLSALPRRVLCLVWIAFTGSCGHPTPKGDVRPSLTPEGERTPAVGGPNTSPSADASTSEAPKASALPTPTAAEPPAPKVGADRPPVGTTPSSPSAGASEPPSSGSPGTSPGGVRTDETLVLSDAYVKKCAFCHGAAGQGGSAGIRGPSLVKYTGDFSKYTAAIRNGVAGTTMGAYKAAKYSDADLAKDFTFFTKKPAL